jgi:hypothetical protein
MKKFYRTIVEIEILSENPFPEGVTLEGIHNEITDGEWSGQYEVKLTEEVDGPAMAKLLDKQGTDPQFFNLNDEGEDEEE